MTLRASVRQWRHRPGALAVAVLSLALAISANTAILSLADALFVRPLPVPSASELVHLSDSPGRQLDVSIWELLRAAPVPLKAVAAFGQLPVDIATHGDLRQAPALAVSGEYFSTLGVNAALGRLLNASDERAASSLVVLDYAYWQSLGSPPDVVGQTVLLDARPFTVIGVTEPRFFGLHVGRRHDVVIPLTSIRALKTPRVRVSIIGRVGSLERATVDAGLRHLQTTIQEQLPGGSSATDAPSTVTAAWTLMPIEHGFATRAQTQYRRPLGLLFGVSGILLLISCLNLANLLLADAELRRSDVAIRRSIGASRGQIVAALLSESVLIVAAAGTGGLLLAVWSANALVGLVSTRLFPIALEVSLDWRVIAVCCGCAAVTTVLCGCLPAWAGSAVNPLDAIRARQHGTIRGGGRLGLTHALVTVQIALAIVLVFGAVVLGRTHLNLLTADPGFAQDRLVVRPHLSGSLPRERWRETFERITDAVLGLREVRAAAFSETTPFNLATWHIPLEVPDRTTAEVNDRAPFFNRVSRGYFAMHGPQLLAGRDVDHSARESATAVWVNEAFARQYFATTNPIGRTVRLNGGMDGFDRGVFEIVGVVSNTRNGSLRNEAWPHIYGAYGPTTPLVGNTTFTIAVERDTSLVRQHIGDVISAVAPGTTLDVRWLRDDVTAWHAQERLLAVVCGVLATLSVGFAALGLYGVMAHAVARRRPEIGVRMAIGATTGAIRVLVLRPLMAMVIAGLVAGAVSWLVLGRVVSSLLYGVTVFDPVAAGAAVAILCGIAALSGLSASSRASRVDPASLLRE